MVGRSTRERDDRYWSLVNSTRTDSPALLRELVQQCRLVDGEGLVVARHYTCEGNEVVPISVPIFSRVTRCYQLISDAAEVAGVSSSEYSLPVGSYRAVLSTLAGKGSVVKQKGFYLHSGKIVFMPLKGKPNRFERIGRRTQPFAHAATHI